MTTTSTTSTTAKQSAKQAAFWFFYREAGYSWNPQTQTRRQGRAETARKLAKAERDARALGYTFEWEYDQDGCIGCDCGNESCDCFTGTEHECLCCVARDANGNVVASLGSVCNPSREYRRVVEAELASEALA